MVVIKNISRSVVGINHPTYPLIAGAEITVIHIFRYKHLVRGDNCSIPGAALAMRSDDYPLFAQGMPALLP
jgi:hypothetical protein